MGTLSGKNAVVTGSTSGIGLAYARAFAGAGANVVINGFGSPEDIEKERAKIESDFGVKAVYSPADMTKPAEIAGMIALGEKSFGSVDILVNNAGIQFVSPIEEFPLGEVGPDHRDQPVLGLPCHPRRGARHEEEGLGPYHQHRVGALAGRLALQVGLCVGQARHRRPDQDRGAGSRDQQDHLQLHQPRLCLDAAGGEADPRYDEGAQPHRASRSSTTCCSTPSRPRSSSPPSRSQRWRCSCAATMPRRSPARTCRSTAAGPRSKGGIVMPGRGAKARKRRAHHRSSRIQDRRGTLALCHLREWRVVAAAQWLQASAVTIADCRFSSANMILPATTTRTLASATRSTVSGTRVAL